MGFYNSIMYSWSYPSHRFCKSFFLTETTKQILGVPMLMASFWLVCFILSFPPLSSTINLNNSPTVLPRGFRIHLPFGEGRNCLFAIPGGAKYNPESFRDGFWSQGQNDPDNYRDGEIPLWLASGIVGFKKFFITSVL